MSGPIQVVEGSEPENPEEQVERFNALTPVGSPVYYKNDFGKFEVTRTRSTAWVAGGVPLVSVEGRRGGVGLWRVSRRDFGESDPTPVDVPISTSAPSLAGVLALDGATSYDLDCPGCSEPDALLVVEPTEGGSVAWRLSCSSCDYSASGNDRADANAWRDECRAAVRGRDKAERERDRLRLSLVDLVERFPVAEVVRVVRDMLGPDGDEGAGS